MPSKLPSHDAELKARMAKIGAVVPAHLARARRYRNSGNWKKIVKIQKQEFPLCCDPFNDHKDAGTSVPMAQVHHVRPLATHYHLRAYAANLRSVCTKCHSKVEQLERRGTKTWYLFKEMPEC